MTIEEKAKMIAEQCRPCSKDFYSGIYQGVMLALKAESAPNILPPNEIGDSRNNNGK